MPFAGPTARAQFLGGVDYMGESDRAGTTAFDNSDGPHGDASASSVLEQAQTTAAQTAQDAKNQARNVAEQQKQLAGEKIDGVADAMKAAAGDLKDKVPLAADYIDHMAGQLNGVASSIRERSVDEMLNEAREFGRRQPAIFFAAAVAAGFALSRFAKSSAKPQGRTHV